MGSVEPAEEEGCSVWGGGRHSAGECEVGACPTLAFTPLFHVHILIN